MSFQKTKHFLTDSAVCSELFTVFKLIAVLLNICTIQLSQLGNLIHIFDVSLQQNGRSRKSCF